MIKLASIFKKFEEAMAASAFAEEGEFDMARQLLKSSKNANKKVLLGMDEAEVDLNLVRYTINLCQRIGAKLEILHVLRPEDDVTQKPEAGSLKGEELLAPFQEDMEKRGIDYQLVIANDSLAEELVSYVGQRRDILCVVLDAAKAGKQRIEKELQKLKCPVVVYGRPLRV